MTDQTESIIELVVPQSYIGLRLDLVLAQLLPHWSRSRLQSWILEKRVNVDGKIATPKQKIWGNEKISIRPHIVGANETHAAEAISLEIIYEDNHLLVINKPAGMVVHPGNGNWQGTLLNALLHHSKQLNNIPRAGIVHRLDKDTSGLLVVAKTIEAQTSLVRQLQEHSVKRDYLAIALGEVKQNGYIDAPIGRHPVQRTKMAVTIHGKPARTYYQILESFDGCTLLRCSLETGRTHQIRVHMHNMGHPLVGDPVYTGKTRKLPPEIARLIMRFPRQALHAQQLAFVHPLHGETMIWNSELPEDMSVLLQGLRQYGTLPSLASF
ncbi:23S rRNA pseudouridine(1911/1915/1917) synthase RluD [Nitrosomonas sp. Is37]|uniref:23S rRNA pseudouridine(1911/1915/1917) synthase RluD n=1 Tax=Nitrosomonas sp. Is37 TaxID=3080535 RepID=UPI00294B2F63|nr:23S rRNA pseudouridine(1911/1915/1917) synthase RluD [Nitrosomonas sp. Is37]MDV6344711.1 23S rRNA pseudouridine(1911/1915/1917) synthase RluD [Nitrosomonas sp. Is37]